MAIVITNPDGTTQKLSKEVDIAAYVSKMEAEKAALAKELAEAKGKPKAASGASFKVSEKKAVSIYGLSGRWPMTFYAGTWDRLLEGAVPHTGTVGEPDCRWDTAAMGDGVLKQLAEFLNTNRTSLSHRSDDDATNGNSKG